MSDQETIVPIDVKNLKVKQIEKVDLLYQIEDVFIRAAKTPEEILLAQAGINRLKEFRSRWKKMLKQAELRAIEAGTTISIGEVVENTRRSNWASTPVVRRSYGTGHDEIENLPSVKVLGTLVTDEKRGKRINPSPIFMERILKGMGALEPNQTLDVLRLLPEDKDGAKGPVYRKLFDAGYADRVPTKYPGLDVMVDFGRPGISVAIDVSTLQNVVNFPKA